MDACYATGMDYREMARARELDSSDFDEWYGEADEIVDLANDFFRAFGSPPDTLATLEQLKEEIERRPRAMTIRRIER